MAIFKRNRLRLLCPLTFRKSQKYLQCTHPEDVIVPSRPGCLSHIHNSCKIKNARTAAYLIRKLKIYREDSGHLTKTVINFS